MVIIRWSSMKMEVYLPYKMIVVQDLSIENSNDEKHAKLIFFYLEENSNKSQGLLLDPHEGGP